MGPLEEHLREEALIIRSLDNLFIATWFDVPSVALLEHLEDIERRQKKRFPSGLGFANVIVGGGLPRFDSELLAKVKAMSVADDELDLVTTHCILMEGLAASAVRAFLSTAVLMSRPQVPLKVCSNLAQAGLFMAGPMNTKDCTWTAARARSALERAQRR
ncbi:MAG: hypothetical protein AAGF12_04730 [Myxococcota bacterium]